MLAYFFTSVKHLPWAGGALAPLLATKIPGSAPARILLSAKVSKTAGPVELTRQGLGCQLELAGIKARSDVWPPANASRIITRRSSARQFWGHTFCCQKGCWYLYAKKVSARRVGGMFWLIFGAKSDRTGTEEAFYLQFESFTINLQGLLLGGIILGVLGVLDDVTTGQVAAIEEIYDTDPSLSFSRLYKKGISVGRELWQLFLRLFTSLEKNSSELGGNSRREEIF